MPTVAFIVNPVRVRDTLRAVRSCESMAKERGFDPLVLETGARGAGREPVGEALAAGAGLVVAVGGDGTVRACAEALAGTAVPLGIAPRGTANLAARALHLPSRLDAAVAVALDGRDRRVDLGGAAGLGFLGMAGMGLDAEVVAATPPRVRRRLGWVGYAAYGVTRLAGGSAGFRVRLDGRREISRRARAVVVGNAGLLPGGFLLLPRARLDDGVLDVGILAPAGALDWARVGGRVILGGRRGDGPLERHRARRVEITADRDLPREVDGELLAPSRDLSVSVRPGALLVRVP